MKIQVITLSLIATLQLVAAPVMPPLQTTSISKETIGTTTRYSVTLNLDEETKLISQAILVVDEAKYVIPAKALTKVLHPDLLTVRIETENGRDGREWYSIVIRSSSHTEHPTRYYISVIDGKFSRVSKSWDEPHENGIIRHREILHKEE